MPTPDGRVRVCLETGGRLSFASALDWPGWARSGRGEEAAVEALRGYARRYAPVARAAGLELPEVVRIDVVERLRGSASTDFGVPEAIAELEREPVPAGDVERLVRLMEAGWKLFDEVVAAAPASLRKGPRGGGRDRDAVVDHVVRAEVELYARKLGLRLSRPALGEVATLTAARFAIADALRAAAGPEPHPAGVRGWPPRYAIRRIAWHVLDHAWEIEDKSDPAPAA
ncbi:MAG: hypothetical protein ABSB36_06980 [Candidatus Dormibacteria bacterium]|jgi:hypothetical protein